MTTMWHGTGTAIAVLDRAICLTADESVAVDYTAWAAEPRVYAVELADSAELADEAELRTAAEGVLSASWLAAEPHVFELADEPRVQAVLAAAGYAGVEYRDTTEGNTRTHDTVLVWDTTALTLGGAYEPDELTH